MAFVPRTLALKVPLLFLLFVTQILQPVAGQAPPAPTPCKGATNTTNKIKDAFIFQGGLSPLLDPGLARALPVEPLKSSAWPNSSIISIPIDCKVAANGKCSLVNIQVYDVLYFQSCNLPWVMCRCLQAEMSQSDTRDRFGMIGSKLRSYVRHFMAFPGPVGAWTDNQDIIIYGSAGNMTIVSGLIHQATHAMDVGLGNFSAQANWTEAVDMDSCVADQTATVSYSEAFAQAMVVHMYAVLNNTFTLDTSCMSSQLGVLQALFPREVLFPQNCDLSVKPPASKTVAQVPDDGNNRPSNSSVATSQTNTPSQTSTTGINSAAIAGMVIGAFTFGVVTFLVCLFWHRHRIAQPKSQGADLHPKGKGTSARMTQPVPWVARGDENIILIENPISPGLLKDEPLQTPATYSDHLSDAQSPDRQRQ